MKKELLLIQKGTVRDQTDCQTYPESDNKKCLTPAVGKSWNWNLPQIRPRPLSTLFYHKLLYVLPQQAILSATNSNVIQQK